jgi:pyruvate kinase
MAKSAVVMADELKADAIVVLTLRGNMARHTAWMRPRHSPIYAFCDSWAVSDALTLNRAVTPRVIEFDYEHPNTTIDNAVARLKSDGAVKAGNTIVIISSIAAGETTVDAVQMRTV